jgi:DNA-binding transcriptional regulator YiaG
MIADSELPLPKLVKVFRAHYDLSQSQLAALLSRTHMTISNWETGKKCNEREVRLLLKGLEGELCKRY